METRMETICWTCTAPGTGRCSWDESKGCVPVQGWRAIETALNMQGHNTVTSYLVLECPLYEPCKTIKNIRFGGESP